MATPHSTPSIDFTSRVALSSMPQNFRTPKPPIHNPYDKFTQPQFESWIGDITSALRKALGHEPVAAANEDLRDYLDGNTEEYETDEGSEEGSEDSQGFEDSFAEVNVRYAKGKARDPREGPGLGSKHQPIDIVSGSEGGDSGEESGYDEKEYSEGSNEDFADGLQSSPIQNGRGTNPDEPIELTSDEEGSVANDQADEQYFQDSRDSRGDEWRGVFERRDHEAGVAGDDSFEANGGYRGNNAPSDYSQSETRFEENESLERQTYSSEGGVFTGDEFPAFRETSPPHPPDLLDPWKGPMTYAEDFYSGGDFRDSDLGRRKPSPSNLTPLYDELEGSLSPVKNGIEDENELFDSRPLSSSPMEQVVTDDMYVDLGLDAHLMGSGVVNDETGPGLPAFEATVDGYPLVTYDSASEHAGPDWSPSPGQVNTEHSQVVEGDEEAGGSATLGISNFDMEREETGVMHDNEGERREEIARNDKMDVEKDGATRMINADFPNIDTLQQESNARDPVAQHPPATGGKESENQLLTTPGVSIQDLYANITTLSESDSFQDFGVLPDPPHELGSVPFGGQEDMPEILSFLEHGKDDHSLDLNKSLDGDERPSDSPILIVAEPETYDEVDELFDGEELNVVSINESVVEGITVDTAEGPALEGRLTEEPDDTPPLHEHNITATEHSELTASPEVPSAFMIPSHHPSAEDVVAGPEMPLGHGDTVNESPQTPEKEDHSDHPMWSPTRSTTCEMQNGIPMPVSADPNVPDPTMQSSSPHHSPSPVHTPAILSLPGTPAILLSPVGTPGMPTPVAVPVPTAVLKAMQMRQSLSTVTSSGLFTPANGSESAPGSPDHQPELDDTETPDAENSNSGIELSTDSLSTSLTAAEPQIDAEIADRVADTPGIDVLENGKTLSIEAQLEGPVASEESDHPELSSSERQPQTDPGVPPHIMIPSIFPVVHRPDPTTPTLCPDPYPYSLSTPGLEFVASNDEGQQDYRFDSPEEENEHSTTSSSSVIRKDLGLPESSPVDFGDEEPEELELVYPSEAESKADTASSTPPDSHRNTREGSHDLNEREMGDVDSNGNSGLDLGVLQDRDRDANQDPTSDPLETAVYPNDDPSLVSDNHESVPDELEGGAHDNNHPHSDNSTHHQPDSPSREAGALEEENQVPDNKLDVGDIVKNPSRRPNGYRNLGFVEKGKLSRSLKRRRGPLSLSQHALSASTFTPTHGRSSRIILKGKGKQKASRRSGKVDLEPPGDDDKGDGCSTSSGASTASRMLRPGSRTTSRSSSILSDAPSNLSSRVMPSSPSADNNSHPPPALFHTHGAIRHHHQPPPSQVTQKLRQKQVAAAAATAAPPSPRAKTSISSPSRSEQSVSQRPPPSSGSPVTRSNCRFHKISLPREEDGPRVYFLVPGCSLGDRQLMEYQKIEDHGFARQPDDTRYRIAGFQFIPRWDSTSASGS